MKILISLCFLILFLLTDVNMYIHRNIESCRANHLYQYSKILLEYNDSNIFVKTYNPSIQKIDNGFILTARNTNKSFNFFLNFNFLSYIYHICNIKNIYVDNDFKIQKETFLETDKLKLEDPRIIKFQDKYFVSYCNHIKRSECFPILFEYTFPSEKAFSQSGKEYTFQNEKLLKKYEYDKKSYYGDRKQNIREKNWCPFEYNNSLYIHTDANPWTIFKLNLDKKENMELILKQKINFEIPSSLFFRCSTSWKEYNQTHFICGLHTKHRVSEQIRSVLVLIDKETLLPTHMTDILCFERDHHIFQFLSGLETDDFNIYIAYGIDDYRFTVRKIPKFLLKFHVI